MVTGLEGDTANVTPRVTTYVGEEGLWTKVSKNACLILILIYNLYVISSYHPPIAESFLAFKERPPRGRDSNLRKYYRCLSKAIKKAPSSAADGEEGQKRGGRPRGKHKRVWNLQERNVPKRQSAAKLEEGWATKETPIGWG